MATRKNAKYLSSTEREDFVKACILMKADIVNPLAAVADQYSKWDQFVALHWAIQNTNAPFASNVNFGHGGTGAYGFLPWHRYFLYTVEQQLQTYVPGVTIPYWDWTDPVVGAVLVADFLGPDGDPASGDEVRRDQQNQGEESAGCLAAGQSRGRGGDPREAGESGQDHCQRSR